MSTRQLKRKPIYYATYVTYISQLSSEEQQGAGVPHSAQAAHHHPSNVFKRSYRRLGQQSKIDQRACIVGRCAALAAAVRAVELVSLYEHHLAAPVHRVIALRKRAAHRAGPGGRARLRVRHPNTGTCTLERPWQRWTWGTSDSLAIGRRMTGGGPSARATCWRKEGDRVVVISHGCRHTGG